MTVVVGINQFSADKKIIAVLNDSTNQHCLDAEVVRHLLRIGNARLRIVNFVAKDRIARDHFYIRQLGKIVDETFGDAISDVFKLGIAINVDKGQDRQRIYRSTARRKILRAGDGEHKDYKTRGDDPSISRKIFADAIGKESCLRDLSSRIAVQPRLNLKILLQFTQISQQFFDCLITLLAILTQRPSRDPLKFRRNVTV